ncbi:MAG: hypothetical protein EBR15_07360, partial [Gammaproteobacteria bacterium]|nr:hypothetical protein [Gammaproteobacteria bacterium]
PPQKRRHAPGALITPVGIKPDRIGDEARHFEPNPLGRYQCDLVGLARARLARAGVVEVSGGSWCTAADPIRFYSHRRDQRTGRMAALLWRAASHRVL